MSISNHIRTNIINARQNLDKKKQEHLSRIIAKKLLKSFLFIKSKRIAFYFSYKGEVDTAIILEMAQKNHKQCFLPVLHPIKHNRLWFIEYRANDKLHKNPYGILEPALRSRRIIAPWTLDMIITPLVSFDPNGNRLGMGGGYYDRTLAFLLRENYLKKLPYLVGLAYEFQKTPQLIQNEWDVPLDMIVTEQNIYKIL